tara:strand:- start:1913 stop:2461 length:549 start_codon:yes stop_codon:yes gene_type:complete
MKKIVFLFYFLIITTSNLFAIEINQKLDKLFSELKTSNQENSFVIEQKIWRLWSTHPIDQKLTLLLAQGSEAVNNNQLNEAINIFTKVINLDPNWAEAWNKRATVLYLIGQYNKSQKDIDKVLKIEKRHFGALAGQGLVNIKLRNYEKAIKSYKKALEIYPSMQSPEQMIKEIEALIKQELI